MKKRNKFTELASDVSALKQNQRVIQDDVDVLIEKGDYPSVKNTGKQSFTMQKDGNAFYFVDKDG